MQAKKRLEDATCKWTSRDLSIEYLLDVTEITKVKGCSASPLQNTSIKSYSSADGGNVPQSGRSLSSQLFVAGWGAIVPPCDD